MKKKKGLLKKVGTALDTALLGGVIFSKNSATDESPAGSINKPALLGGVISSIALLVLLYLLATGKISFDEFKEGVEAIPGQ